jgi:hypothetical protein
MKAVKNVKTNRLVFRCEPEFEQGQGIKDAVSLGLGPEAELAEVEITQEDWDEELRLRKEEAPTVEDRLQKQIDELKADVEKLKAEKI